MPDLAIINGPLRITTVLNSAHGGYLSIPRGGTGPHTVTSTNSSIFRATTRFLVSPRNATALAYAAASFIRVSANNTGTITVTKSAAGAAGTMHWYFLAFNGGTAYTVV
jgi:hypothetical protein